MVSFISNRMGDSGMDDDAADKVKYIHFNGKYWKVVGEELVPLEGEDDKSVLSDLSHADLGFGGEDSG